MLRNLVSVFLLMSIFTFAAWAEPPRPPLGADAVPDLYSAYLAGEGGFTTTTGGAPASAYNPAQAGTAHRMIFDAHYLTIPIFSDDEDGYMQSIAAGMLFPTRYGVFGGSFRFISGFGTDMQYPMSFPIGNTLGGNIFAAKEVYPGMSFGAGLNYGFGEDWTLSGDLGFHYNTGTVGPFENFTWAFALRELGKSYFPTWLTPAGGISFDMITVKGEEGKPDPFKLNAAIDISLPSVFYFPYTSMILKTGLKMIIAEILTLSVSWPGGSGLNARELADNAAEFQPIPSIGVGFNIMLPSGGERIAGGRLPSDGDLKIDAAYKPLYNGVAAIGGGVSWYVGLRDTTPPVIEIDYPETAYFSPNNDGKADYLEVPIKITDDNYVVSWKVEIKDEFDNLIRNIENKEQRFESFNFREFWKRLGSEKKHIDIPTVIIWDGFANSGELMPDGKYFFTITATDDSDNTSITEAYEVVLRNTPPEIAIEPIADSQKIFDPKGEGGRVNISFIPRGSYEDAWESGIWNAAGEQVRKFEPESGNPTVRIWDGRNDAGQIAPDGVYSYRISATDKAQNSASAEMTNIILDTREAGAFLISSVSAIAPASDQSSNLVDFTIRLLMHDGITNWKLELRDESDTTQRTFSGDTQVPETMGWNGLDEEGNIREGVFTPLLTVNYVRGDIVTASATTVRVDVSGPELTLTSSPEYFSPDNDGVDDELFIRLTATDASPIASWSLEIREPEPPYNLFRRFEGRGTPTSQLIWDGKSDKGELVQSATDYPWTFTATDVLGNASSIEGKFGIDILVIRDGDRLKILIPSIVFRPNAADFDGLSRETVDNNTRILRRIAQILNKFRDYRVVVEGHANPTQPPGPGRDREEPELKRISEARARAVVDQLVRYGVARSRLSYTGAGGTSPVVEFEDRDNWWKNRRVEFILIK
ncbi:MAG: OmpA family protein [Treponema sp.]|nr:OmpA family protein [Treponema sp.]